MKLTIDQYAELRKKIKNYAKRQKDYNNHVRYGSLVRYFQVVGVVPINAGKIYPDRQRVNRVKATESESVVVTRRNANCNRCGT